MVDKKRKIANSSENTSYESKFSKVVKLIESCVVDVVKHEKVFHCNDIAQILSVLFQEGKFYFKKARRQHKKELAGALNRERKSTYLDKFEHVSSTKFT